MKLKALWQHRAVRALLALVVVGAFGGVGVALASGGSGNATMTAHAAPAPSKPAPAPPTTTPAPPTTVPVPAATPAPTPAQAVGTVDVHIINFKFTPATLTIKAGTTVTWTNKDAIGHTVNFHANGINSPSVLNQGDRFSHAFTTPGTYAYICDIHPFMHGTVVVTA